MGFFDDLVSQKKRSVERTGTFGTASLGDQGYLDTGVSGSLLMNPDVEQPTTIDPQTGKVYVSDADVARGMFGLTGYAPEETLHRTGSRGTTPFTQGGVRPGVSFFGSAGEGAGSGHDLAHEITLTGNQGYRIKTDADKAGPASTSLLDDIIGSQRERESYLKPDIDPRFDPNKPTQSASDASSSMPGDERVRGGTPFGRSSAKIDTRPDDYTGGLFDEYRPPEPTENYQKKKYVPIKVDTFVEEQTSRGVVSDYDAPKSIAKVSYSAGSIWEGQPGYGDNFEVTAPVKAAAKTTTTTYKPKVTPVRRKTTTFYAAEY